MYYAYPVTAHWVFICDFIRLLVLYYDCILVMTVALYHLISYT